MALQIPLTLVRLQLCLSAHTLNQLSAWLCTSALQIDDDCFDTFLSVCTRVLSLLSLYLNQSGGSVRRRLVCAAVLNLIICK